MVYFGDKEKNAANLPHSAQRKHSLLREINQMSKSKKISTRKKVALDLLQYRLGNMSTRSLMAGYTETNWKDIKLRIDPDPFCTSCQIFSMNKRLNPKIH